MNKSKVRGWIPATICVVFFVTLSALVITSFWCSSPNAHDGTVVLLWDAPGDDLTVGTAAAYDLRYSTTVITEANFGDATQATGVVAPMIAGTEQSHTITGLTVGATYYFAIKAIDESNNIGPLSNVVEVDGVGPAAIILRIG